MKIAYVYDAIHPFVLGGAQKRVWELARRMVQRGHEVTLFGMKFWEGDSVTYREGVRLWGVCRPEPFFAGAHRSIKQAIIYAWKLLGPLSAEKFDVVDCQEFPYLSCFVAKIICTMKREPFIITWYEYWGEYWLEYLGQIKGTIGRFIETLTLRLPDKIIPISERIKSDLVAAGISNSKLKVVLNGIDFHGIGKIPAALESCDIIYAGRLAEHKNVDMLLKATAILARDFPFIKCIIIGDGPEKTRLEKLASELTLTANVKFLGFLAEDSDVMAYIKSAKVFVLLSKREGFPNTIIEANSCSVPVVIINAKDNAGIDAVKDGKTGFIVDQSEEAISDKLHRLLTDTEMQAKMKDESLKYAEQYDWPAVVSELESVYIEVLNGAT